MMISNCSNRLPSNLSPLLNTRNISNNSNIHRLLDTLNVHRLLDTLNVHHLLDTPNVGALVSALHGAILETLVTYHPEKTQWPHCHPLCKTPCRSVSFRLLLDLCKLLTTPTTAVSPCLLH